jgi:hypothetical protein
LSLGHFGIELFLRRRSPFFFFGVRELVLLPAHTDSLLI